MTEAFIPCDLVSLVNGLLFVNFFQFQWHLLLLLIIGPNLLVLSEIEVTLKFRILYNYHKH